MSGRREPRLCDGSLEVLFDNEVPYIDIIAVEGPGQEAVPWATSIKVMDQEDGDGTPLELLLHKQIGARIMRFRPIIAYGADFVSPDCLTQIAGLLLEKVSAVRREKYKDRVVPVAYMTHGLGGVIVKKALIMAEKDAGYHDLSHDSNRLIFFDMLHRTPNARCWEDPLLNTLLASPLPSSQMRNIASQLRRLSDFLQEVSERFISSRARRCIVNVYSYSREWEDADCAMNRYSATTDLVHETNFPEELTAGEVLKLSKEGPAVPAILGALKAETSSGYRKCLLRLHEICPTFSISEDQRDLYTLESNLDVQSAFETWLDTSTSCIVTTSGGWNAGKSLCARNLFRKLKKLSRPIAYYTFAESNVSRHFLGSFLASVAFQVLSQNPERFLRIEDLVAAIEARNAWSEAALFVLFKSVLDAKGLTPYHLVIDDSHQCDSVSKLIDMLMAVLDNEEAPTKLKIALFYNSQTGAGCDIETALRKHGDKFRMNGPILTSDTLASLATKLVEEAVNRRPYLYDLKTQLSVALGNCSHTVEMLCLIQSLEISGSSSDPRTLRSLDLLISSYQPSVSDTISSIFQNLSDWGRRALGWITHSKRPLTLDELEIAVAITNKDATFSSTFDPKDLPIDLRTDMQSQFGPLVMLGAGEVTFRDRTVKAKFVNLIDADRDAEPIPEKEASSKIPGDVEITDILLSYLSWQDFITPVQEALQADKGAFIPPHERLFGLMTYAVQFLPFHYRASTDGDGLLGLTQSHQLAIWQELDSRSNRTTSPQYDFPAEPFSLAAQLGLTEVMHIWGKDLTPENRKTAVNLASWGGHIDTVSELLDEGVRLGVLVDISQSLVHASARGHKAVADRIVGYAQDNMPQELAPLLDQLLCCAAELGYDDQVSSWIGLGSNVNASPFDITPLQHASRNGHASIVQHLLQYEGIDVHCRAGTGADEPILLAAMKGYDLVMDYLLTAEASVTSLTKDATQRTPLYLAAEYGHEAIVRRLLEAESSDSSVLNRQRSTGLSPLMISCRKGFRDIARKLLDANADVKLWDDRNNSALYFALRPGEEELAMEVLNRASSVQEFKDICDVFLESSSLGFEKLVRHCLETSTRKERASLLEYSSPTGDGRVALHNAAERGHIRIVELLLRWDATVDPLDDSNTTPLALAAEAGETDIVRLLLQYDANALLRTSDGKTIITRVVTNSQNTTKSANVVSILLEDTDTNPNALDEHGRTALHWAASLGKLEMVKALLRSPKVDPKIAGRWGYNALHFAAHVHNVSAYNIADVLIKAGTDALGTDINDWLPIHLASREGNIQLLELLLEHSPQTLEARTDDGSTVLRFGLYRAESVEWLLKHGANPDVRSFDGLTPLMAAASSGEENTVRVLLDGGCDVNITDGNRQTALHLAAYRGNVGVGRQLLEKHRGILHARDNINLSALHHAIRSRQQEFAAMLLDEFYANEGNSDLDDLCAVEDNNKETALISAIKTGQYDIARKLLYLGVDTEHRDSSGLTALLAIVERSDDNDLEMLRALLVHADVNAGGGSHPTALHNAARDGKQKVVEELIESGAQVNKQGGQYNTALCAAAVSGYHDIATYLLGLQSPKADPNLSAGDLANALCASLYSQTYELVAPLLERGADINAKDSQGRSALHIAAQRGSWTCMEHLLTISGADTYAVDTQGRGLMHHAAMSGQEPFFVKLLSYFVFDLKETNIQTRPDNDGWVPLHWACRHSDNLKIVEVMGMISGVDFALSSNDGWTPENIAITHSADDIASYIHTKLRDSSSEITVSEVASDADSEPDYLTRWKVGYVHWGVSCDGCFLFPMVGVRWHCKNCVDFDFCFKCYWSVKETHDPNHRFTPSPDGESTERSPQLEED
ncbi:ankyrin repeat-containing domain protein [Trichoderma gracile]